MTTVQVVESGQVIVEVAPAESVVIESRETVILTLAEQGPPGIQGPRGFSGVATFEVEAGEDISALRAIRLVNGKAFYCDGNDPTQLGECVGMSLTASLTGGEITVLSIGQAVDLGWSWPTGAVYIGGNGVLSSVPGTAFVQEIGQGSGTTLFVNLKSAILRG